MEIGEAREIASIEILAKGLYKSIKEVDTREEAWGEVSKFLKGIDKLRTELDIEEMEGHTTNLAGMDLPIMVNSICDKDGNWTPSKVAEMHIGKFEGEDVLLITPEIVSIEEEEDLEI